MERRMRPSNRSADVAHATGAIAAPAPIYYETFSPVGLRQPTTVVMVHGGAHSGACYQATAAGEPGWAYQFARRGYRTIVPDWPGTGRSGHVKLSHLTGDFVVRALAGLLRTIDDPVVLLTHSMSGAYGWRLLEQHGDRIAAVVGVAPAPPGNIQPHTPGLLETADSVEVMMFGERVRIDKHAMHVNGRAFVDRKLIGSSSRFPHKLRDAYAANLLPIPPRLLIERQNINGLQLKVSDTPALRDKPILVITGTNDFDHPREVDGAIAGWFRDLGARAEFCWLGDYGITGNGHMLMLEDNAAEIADIILHWIDKQCAVG